jgi:hypothetical protein
MSDITRFVSKPSFDRSASISTSFHLLKGAIFLSSFIPALAEILSGALGPSKLTLRRSTSSEEIDITSFD